VRSDNDGRDLRAAGVFGAPLPAASGSLSRETGLDEALDALLKASRSPSISSSLVFMLEADVCRGFGCDWRKGSTPRGFLNPGSATAFRVDVGAVDSDGFVRDLTAPLGAGFGRMLEAEACFFDAGAELDGLARGRREILVGIADGLMADCLRVDGDDDDDDDGRVNWGAGESMTRRRVFLVRVQEHSFLGRGVSNRVQGFMLREQLGPCLIEAGQVQRCALGDGGRWAAGRDGTTPTSSPVARSTASPRHFKCCLTLVAITVARACGARLQPRCGFTRRDSGLRGI